MRNARRRLYERVSERQGRGVIFIKKAPFPVKRPRNVGNAGARGRFRDVSRPCAAGSLGKVLSIHASPVRAETAGLRGRFRFSRGARRIEGRKTRIAGVPCGLAMPGCGKACPVSGNGPRNGPPFSGGTRACRRKTDGVMRSAGGRVMGPNRFRRFRSLAEGGRAPEKRPQHKKGPRGEFRTIPFAARRPALPRGRFGDGSGPAGRP